MINQYSRLAATLRRLQFEILKVTGVPWVINKVSWLQLKQPWLKLYNRENKSNNPNS